MKKGITFLLTLLMICCGNFAIVSADAQPDIAVVIDGEAIAFDVAPRLVGSRTMVPMRAIFEALGAEVNWESETQTITAYNEISVVKCTIGDNTMYINNIAKTIDVPPMIIDARTLVPVRFIAESFDCDVLWNSDTFTVSITTKPIDYTEVEQETVPESSTPEPSPAPTPTAPSNKGTRSNPYSASDGKTVTYNEWSSEPARQVAITCTNIIRGNSANKLAASENRFNDTPSSSQEWVFMEFNVNYISSEDGEDDMLEGSDVIYKDTFFTESGSAIPVADMATLGDTYRGNGVFDVELYPGASAKVVIGLLTDKNIDTILLRIPNKGDNSNTWINCTDGASSSYSENEDNSENSTSTDTSYIDDDEEEFSSNVSYYPGTTVPTYTSLVGTPLSDTYTGDSGIKTYIYDYDKDDFVDYIISLERLGWTEYKHTNEDLRLTYYLTKGSKLISVIFAAKFNQVWIIAG